LLLSPVAALAAPWTLSGFLRQASGTSAKVLAVAVLVQNEDGGPVIGLEPASFAVDYLIPTPTTSLFFRGEISQQRPDGFAEQEPGMYVMYVTTTHNSLLVRGASVRVFGPPAGNSPGAAPSGAKVQKAGVFLRKEPN
jgi:hypothetical protein